MKLKRDLMKPKRDIGKTDTAVRANAAVSIGQHSRMCKLMQP